MKVCFSFLNTKQTPLLSLALSLAVTPAWGDHNQTNEYGQKQGHWTEFDNQGNTTSVHFVDGKMIVRMVDGSVVEAQMVNDKKHGMSVMRYADGFVAGGRYVDGKPHGEWVVRREDGAVEKGRVVNGIQSGRWVIQHASGDVEKGTYLNGEKHGNWIMQFEDGDIEHPTYYEGELVLGYSD